MRIVLRTVLFLLILAALGLVAYAVFSDLPAPRQEVTQPIDAK